ncbi:TonB-dependent receptor [Teredinibacter sp. KSP-S5-2]|uniref:TonB-dependent receptor n=1 Tax=Teredinibacter sp. KSP-S5-2 TaxID=3034506 RepID=UPI002934D620|nr:TonB-dependent receptor [Teredinibacter sp. KSP-S5-2]WNO11466.1 TonB-dependent receptor [Teredinibacter sp. KSP-S5-2]
MFTSKHRVTTLSTLCACVLCTNATADEIVLAGIQRTPYLEEIRVIGEKTERSLKDTASSVSVLAEEALSNMQHLTVTDAVSEVSNVVSLSGSVPDIRGVSGNGSAGGFNSISGGAKGRVSILVDGVAQPFVADLTGDSGMWDVEQIEVFRGPQSTNNGRNSIAGSIFIKTKDPSNEWEGAARIGFRDQEQYIDTSAMISGPIVDDTLAFRISLERVDGETITDEKGYDSNPADYDLNEVKTSKARAKLKWTPLEDLSAMLTYSSNNEQGDTGRVYYMADDIAKHQRLYFRDIETDSNTTSLNIDYAFSDDTSLSILVASMDYEWGFDSYEPNPETEQQLVFDENNITFDTRLNFGINNENLNGFVGLAYFEREHDVISGGAYVYYGKDESDSKAIYGEVTFGLSSNFKLTTGARFERESQLRDFTYDPIVAQLDQSNSIFLPKIVLQYQASEQTTWSLSARKGYNAAGGALNFTAQEYYYFDEETVNTYELGSRSSFADDTVFLSTNLFYNDYDGYQALSSTRFIVNMEEVVTYGAEVELSASLINNLELTAALGLLNTEIKDAGEEYPDVNGNELNSAPTLTANLGTKYWFTEGFHIGVSANYVDEYYGDFSNTEERIAGDYTLVRVNSGYQFDHWKISAFVNNALDEEGIVTKEPAGRRYPTGYVSVVTPRNIGVSVTYSF